MWFWLALEVSHHTLTIEYLASMRKAIATGYRLVGLATTQVDAVERMQQCASSV